MANPTDANPLGRGRGWMAAGVAALIALLYLVPAATTGLWEPWETAPATLARGLSDGTAGSIFAPMKSGALFSRPWLASLMGQAGFMAGGGSEFGLRLPALLLVVAAAAAGFLLLDRWVGRRAALLGALLFAMVPQSALGATHLAADGLLLGLFSCLVVAVAEMAASNRDRRPGLAVTIGLLVALTAGARGGVGLALALGLLAVSALGLRPTGGFCKIGLAVGLALFAALLIPAGMQLSGGWEAGKERFGLAMIVGPALLLTLTFGPKSRLRALFHGPGAPAAGIVALAGVALPLVIAAGETGWPEALSGFLSNAFFTSRTLPLHPTFDVLIRVTGYSLYPAIVFLPLAVALALRHEDSDRGAILAVAIGAMGIGFLVLGLSSTLAAVYLMPVAMPLAILVASALTEARPAEADEKRSATWSLAGFAALVLLAVTTKDVAESYNKELGVPGPQVLFESIFLDGPATFPSSYRLDIMRPLIAIWGLLLVAVFFSPIAQLSAMGRTLTASVSGMTGRLASLVGGAGSLLQGLAARLGGLFTPARSGLLVSLALALSILGWGGELLFQAIPEAADHFSQKGILEEYETLSKEGEPLLIAGIASKDTSYYFGAASMERLPRVTELEGRFCNATGRLFAVIPAASLGELYATLKRVPEAGRSCKRPPELFVVDGRSSRFLLLSNELHTDRGERDQNYVAESIFSKTTLPKAAKLATKKVTVDGKLRLYATEMAAEVGSGDPLVVTTYWEVLSRIPSDAEMFIHVDFGGNRINGDHKPVGGKYPMQYWVPGDIIRDVHTMPVSRADKSGDYTVWGGFFRGDDRLKVSPKANDDRVNFGKVAINKRASKQP